MKDDPHDDPHDDPRMTPEVRAFAAELNAEFVKEYARDPQFRKEFNSYLRDLGVCVVDEPERTTH